MVDHSLSEQFASLVEGRIAEATFPLREELDLVKAQYDALRLEDQGWRVLFGVKDESEYGMSLATLKNVSKRLRESVAGSPLPKQANYLRYSYTFSQPFIIPNREGSTETPDNTDQPQGRQRRPGRKTDKERFYSSPVNQRYLFGKEAQQLISTACSTDGLYLALGDNNTKEVRPVPLAEIEAYLLNSDFPGEVWAYLRAWNPDPGNPNSEVQRRWYYTDRYTGTKEKSISITGPKGTNESFPTDVSKTLIDFTVNSQVGWTFGVPDLMAGEVWNRNYITMMNHGKEVSETLAYYSAKVKQRSVSGANNTGVKIGNTSGGGNTISVGEGNELDVFSSAGKTYDFEGLRPVAAMYAASVGVSIVDLLASPSAAGSSYGSAAALAPGMRRGIEARRAQIAAWMERLIFWGTGEWVQVTPASIEEVEPYRKMQILKLAEMSGLFHEDEIRPEMAFLANITLKHDSHPEGYLMPNNEKSLSRSDVDADATGGTTTASSPDQGKSNGSGGGGSTTANDQRTDKVSK